MSGYFWQLILADLVFLGLAACLGIWFRRWLRAADDEVDQRLAELDAHGARLARLVDEVQTLCRRLEQRPAERGAGRLARRAEEEPEAAVARSRPTEERYVQACRLVDQGLPAVEVARRLELGLAEVELMVRMQRYRGA